MRTLTTRLLSKPRRLAEEVCASVTDAMHQKHESRYERDGSGSGMVYPRTSGGYLFRNIGGQCSRSYEHLQYRLALRS